METFGPKEGHSDALSPQAAPESEENCYSDPGQTVNVGADFSRARAGELMRSER